MSVIRHQMVIAEPQAVILPFKERALPVAAYTGAPAFPYGQRHAQPFARSAARRRRGEREALLQSLRLVHIPFRDCGLGIADCGFLDLDTVAVGGEYARHERFERFAVPGAGESQSQFRAARTIRYFARRVARWFI